MFARFTSTAGEVSWNHLKGFRIAACLRNNTLDGNFRVELFIDEPPGVPLEDGQIPPVGTPGILVLRPSRDGTGYNYVFDGLRLVTAPSLGAPGLHAALLAFEFAPRTLNHSNAGPNGHLIALQNLTELATEEYQPAAAPARLWGSFKEADAITNLLQQAAKAEGAPPPITNIRNDKPLITALHQPFDVHGPAAAFALLTLTAKRTADNSWLNLLLRANVAQAFNFTLNVNAVSFVVNNIVSPFVGYEELGGRFKDLKMLSADKVLAAAHEQSGAILREWIETKFVDLLPFLMKANGAAHRDAVPSNPDDGVIERLTVPFLTGPAVSLAARF